MQGAHEAASVIVNFFAGGCSSYENDVRLQAFDLSLDVVHPAKYQNLIGMSVEDSFENEDPQQRVGECGECSEVQ
jgi:hypothetical protein